MKKIYTLLIALFVFASFAFANVSWVGNSHIYIKLGSTETWYTGSANFEQPAGYFHGAELGTFSENFEIGGELQVWEAQETDAYMYFSIDGKDPVEVALPKTANVGNNSLHTAKGLIDISSLSPGQHSIAVWFKHTETYDNNNSNNFVATFIVAGTDVYDVVITAPSMVFEGEDIEFSAVPSENFNSPITTYSVKLPGSDTFVAATSPIETNIAGIYTIKADVVEDGDETTTATSQKEVEVLELPLPITVKIQVPESWSNVHFFNWTDLPGYGGFITPTKIKDNVYEYTFTKYDKVNFIVVNGNDWADSPEQTEDLKNVEADGCYKIGSINASSKYDIDPVDCGDISVNITVNKVELAKIITGKNSLTIIPDSQVNLVIYSITGAVVEQIYTADKTQLYLNNGVYIVSIDGVAKKVIVR